MVSSAKFSVTTVAVSLQLEFHKRQKGEMGVNQMPTEMTSTNDDQSPGKPWPVMVLAHNEERHIVACLDSILESDPDGLAEVFVMANGCTDSTERLVEEYSKEHPQVHLVTIEMPDKCNAWNVFIHETAVNVVPGRSVYFFVDGDARLVPGSLAELSEGLKRNPHAHAASAPPASGRSMKEDRRELLEDRHLVANLYALRGSFVESLQAKQVRLPLGLEGDDGLIGALAKWDLNPDGQEFDDMRIEPCEKSGFTFESFSPARWGDWAAYWKRSVRYGRRRYEFTLLGARLRERGIEGLPVHISEVYGKADTLELMKDGIYTIPNWFALREMRRVAQAQK